MAIQIQGNGGTVAEVDGSAFRAIRATLRPVDIGALGAYRASHLSGTMAAALAANAEILQFRWADATRLAVITKVNVDAICGSGTAFTAGFGNLGLFVARSWTADGSGGTAVTMTGNNQKLRSSFGTSLVGAIRGSSTAALTAGTKTLDSAPIGLLPLTFGTVASVQYATNFPIFGEDTGTKHPIVLAQNEGIVVRATVPATGTWQFGITVEWSEVNAY